MTETRSSLFFALASLGPAAVLVAGALWGGILPYLGLAMMTLTVFVLDRSSRMPGAQRDLLPLLIAVLHFGLLLAAVWHLAQWGNWSPGQVVAQLLGMGLFFGQVSGACAHELIHRRSRFARNLGVAMYISLLNGQHVSAHLLVHHIHAGTDKDRNSAPLGHGLCRHFLKASVAEFAAGWRAENARHKSERLHRYAIYLAGGAMTLFVAFILGGTLGLGTVIALCLYAQMQLLLPDYVQHFGLRRRFMPNGKPEPMGRQHRWTVPPVAPGEPTLVPF